MGKHLQVSGTPEDGQVPTYDSGDSQAIWQDPTGGGGGTPGGSDTQVQFNSAGDFAGDSGFTYSNNVVTIEGDVTATGPQLIVLDNATPASGNGAGILGRITSTPTASTQTLGFFFAGANGKNTAGMLANATQAWTLNSAQGTQLQFLVTANGSATRAVALTLDQDSKATFAGHVALEGVTSTGATGSGAIVFGTSPTLTTPALGTPSAIVLTNATGTAASLTAGKATVLATARTINGVSFDGSGNITVAAALSTLTGAGTGVLTALAIAVGTSGGPVVLNGAGGTPSAITLTNATGLVASTGTTATGTPSSTTYLRGDNTWATPAGGGFTNPMTSVGDIIQGTTAGAAARLASVATGNALISGGVTTASSWGKIGLTTHVSGTLPVANGGTNSTTQNWVDLTTAQASIGGAKTWTAASTFSAAMALNNKMTITADITSVGPQFAVIDTAAIGTSNGAGIVGRLTVSPTATGQTMAFYLGGANGNNSGGMLIASTQAWTAGSIQGTQVQILTTPNGSSTRTIAVTFNQDQSATFAGVIFPQQHATTGAPAYVKGGMYFDTTLNKLRIGGATAWETVTSA